MTDRRASFEGLLGRPRHRSPTSEASPAQLDGEASGSDRQSASAAPRRRSLRTKLVPDETPQPTSPTWVDDKGDSRKAKGGRATLRKAAKASPQTPASPETSATEQEKDAVGFLPKLSRIIEGKQSRTLRRRRNSTVSSREDYTPVARRRRPVEDATLTRRPIRHKHGSLQRHIQSLGALDDLDSLGNLPNPSSVSLVSGLTQLSSASSGSNSTITQQSYDKSHIIKRKPIKERKRLQVKTPRGKRTPKAMDPQDSGVFRYMNESLGSEHFLNGQPQGARPSTSSSSSSGSTQDSEDGRSSNADEPVVESPLTSPASMRRTDYGGAPDHDGLTDTDTSIGEPGPESVQSHEESHDVEDVGEGEEEQEEEEGEGEGEYEDQDESSDEEDGNDQVSVPDSHRSHGSHRDHVNHMALDRVPPPRLPSASSRHSDPHTRRLRRQEQALNEHVLQSPQPHRDFQFVGGPSPYSNPAMPAYDSYLHSGASPVGYYATAPQAPPPAPPPPPIGYYSPPHAPPVPYSSGNENHFAMAPYPPMAASSAVVQPPPFNYSSPHPPHYQPQPTGPDLTKTTVVGYELLADKLSEETNNDHSLRREDSVVPMYRKFEQLNHRVLLHLQDEISELEEELRYLDEAIAQCSPRDEAGHMYPASRRGDARYGNDLHFRRTELLGRVYLKLGQYNSALSSFSNITKNLDPANTEQIQAYRTWIEKRTPIDHAETRFLDRQTDLLAVSRRSATSVGGVSSHQSAAIWLPLILVLPLMAFGIVPGLLGRLFILVLIGAAIVKTLTTTKELMEIMSIREWAGCFSIYFGLMAVLAALVH